MTKFTENFCKYLLIKSLTLFSFEEKLFLSIARVGQVNGPGAAHDAIWTEWRKTMDDLELSGESQERITILTDSFDAAAMEFHKRRMATKGYRLENRIAGHTFFMSEGTVASKLFDGDVKYAVTFVRD